MKAVGSVSTRTELIGRLVTILYSVFFLQGDDSTVTCIEKDGHYDIQFSFNNPDHHNDRHRSVRIFIMTFNLTFR